MGSGNTRAFCLGVAVAGLILMIGMCFMGCVEEPALTAPEMLGMSSIGGRLTYSWDAPTTGTPVVYYVIQVHWTRGPDFMVSDIMRKYHTIYSICDDTVRVRVAGVDSMEIQGPYSIWSEPYYSPGAQQLDRRDEWEEF